MLLHCLWCHFICIYFRTDFSKGIAIDYGNTYAATSSSSFYSFLPFAFGRKHLQTKCIVSLAQLCYPNWDYFLSRMYFLWKMFTFGSSWITGKLKRQVAFVFFSQVKLSVLVFLPTVFKFWMNLLSFEQLRQTSNVVVINETKLQ